MKQTGSGIGLPLDLHFWTLIHSTPETWHYSITSVR